MQSKNAIIIPSHYLSRDIGENLDFGNQKNGFVFHCLFRFVADFVNFLAFGCLANLILPCR